MAEHRQTDRRRKVRRVFADVNVRSWLSKASQDHSNPTPGELCGTLSTAACEAGLSCPDVGEYSSQTDAVSSISLLAQAEAKLALAEAQLSTFDCICPFNPTLYSAK